MSEKVEYAVTLPDLGFKISTPDMLATAETAEESEAVRELQRFAEEMAEPEVVEYMAV